MPLYDSALLTALYARAAQPAYSNKVAIQQVGGMSMTYAQLMMYVENVAQNLLANDFKADDRVLLLVRPSVYTMIIVLAIVRAGGTVIIGDLAMGKDVFESRMRFARPQWVFAESTILLLQKWDWLRTVVKQRGIEIPEISNMGSLRVVNVGAIPFLGDMTIGDLQQPAYQATESIPRDPESDLMIVFTSGTTGAPKGVVHTYRSTEATLQRISRYLDLNDRDVFYTYALHLTIPVLIAGGSAVLPPKKVTPEKTLHAYHAYRITKTFDVPANIRQVVERLREKGQMLPDTLQTIMLGAAPVFSDFLSELQPFLPDTTQVWSIYGMTEMLPVCAVSMTDKISFDARHGDLVGAPLDGISVRLAEDGELIIAGEGLYNRYLGQQPVDEHATGDIATLIDGQVTLLGRKKDMIIRGNNNIYPLLFEPTIREISGVADCALIGVYNSQKADEEIVLVIDGDIREVDLVKALVTGDHSIDVYAHPDHILYITIPRSGRNNKVDRKALRETVRQRLHITDKRPVLEQPS